MPQAPESSGAWRKLARLPNGLNNQSIPRRQPKRLKRKANMHPGELGTDCETSPPPRLGDTPSHQDRYQAWKRRRQTGPRGRFFQSGNGRRAGVGDGSKLIRALLERKELEG